MAEAVVKVFFSTMAEKEDTIILVTALVLLLLFGVMRVGIRLAWSMTKFVFGLGLFWVCPLLFVLAVSIVMIVRIFAAKK